MVVGTAVLSLVFALSLPLLPWVTRHTEFVVLTRRHLQRFAPLYLVAGPPAIVYVALCGPLAFLGFFGLQAIQVHLLHHPFDTLPQMEQHGLVAMLKGSEYVGSFVGAFIFVWIIRWVRLPRFWLVILALSLGLCAAYRTARHEPGENGQLLTGPAILASPEWMDALPVLLGIASAALVRRSNPPPGNGQRPEQLTPALTRTSVRSPAAQ